MMDDVLSPQKEKHLKVILLMTLVFSINLAMILFATVYILAFYNNDYSYYLLFIYENVTLLLENTRIYAKYGGFVCEIYGLIVDKPKKSDPFVTRLLSAIFNSETIYVTQFVLEILLLLIGTIHYMHVWYNNGLQFAVIDILLFALINNTFNEFRIQAKKLMEYKKITNLLTEHYPIPDVEELKQTELCSICHENFHPEDINLARKLECGHIFHLSCIMQWMRCSTNCPICRRDLSVHVENQHFHVVPEEVHTTETSHQGDEHAEGATATTGNESTTDPHLTTTLLSTSGNWLPFSLQIQETTSDIDTSDDEEGLHDSLGSSMENVASQ